MFLRDGSKHSFNSPMPGAPFAREHRWLDADSGQVIARTNQHVGTN
jgi:hypothetical protein